MQQSPTVNVQNDFSCFSLKNALLFKSQLFQIHDFRKMQKEAQKFACKTALKFS